jgi:hypothetical protein
MKEIINDIINNLSTKRVSDGNILITIIFHNGNWKDILIANSQNNDINMEEIGKTGFFEILKLNKSFPEFGQIEYELLIINRKVIKYKIKRINRIHNMEDKKVKE